MKKTWIRLILILLLMVVFLYFFFRSVEWKEVFNYLTGIDIKIFILVILLTPVHLATRGFRWKYLLMHEKKDVKFSNMFAGNAVGFTVTLIFPGRLGELVKPLYLAQKERMSKGFVIGTVVVERTFDLFTMSFLLGLFLISEPLYSSYFQAKKEAFSNLYLWGIVAVSFATVLLVFSLSLYFFKEKTLSIVRFILKPFPQGISEKVLELSHEFIQGLKFFHSVGNLLIYILLSFVVWVGIIFYYWVFFFAYDISLPFFFLFPYTFLVMVGASIPTPGMVGGFHSFSKFGLTSLFNIDINLAVAMTIVVHALQLIVTCLIGYAILWKEGISIFQLKKLGEKESQ
jgi:uncharacterized protein (TIRG00374 family)